jgi:hypothetical protein
LFKKKCGNCRFFENNNMAGSGWCRHPDRVQLNNLVMVRKTELACRNSWDVDLWEPLQAGRRINIEQPVVEAPERLPFVPAEGATDRVTDISVPLVKRPVAPLTAPGTRLFGPTGDMDADDDVDAVAVLPWLKARGDAPIAPVEPSSTAGDPPDLPAQNQPAPPHDTPAILQPLVDFLPPPERSNQPRMERPRELTALDQEVRALLATVEPAPARPKQSGGVQYTEPLPELPTGGVTSRQTKPLGPTAALLRAEPPAHVLTLTSGPAVLDAVKNAPPNRPERDLFDRIDALSGLPRCCGTCRDFRSNADGRTGICASRYTYLDDPVVKSDELACSSSAGIWWLPNDEVFVKAADTAQHARPTPFLDAVLGQRAGSDAGRDSRAR